MSSKLKIDTRVRSLKAYLDDFEFGKIEIPSFQRNFVWSKDKTKQLFDSIKRNYPIGSIQFWKPSENGDKWIGKSSIGPYKRKPVHNYSRESIYILDGFQRLSSLFGCLTNPNRYNQNFFKFDKTVWEKKFNLYYDLEEEEFFFPRKVNSLTKSHQIPVYMLVNSVDFRKYSREHLYKINDEEKVDLYLDRADVLGQIFINYQIPSVDINYASIEEAVEIFKRVNSTGQPISKDWIVSALTNKDGFRLGTEIDKLLEELKLFDFGTIKRDIIFQCIQSSFGKIYFDYKIEDLAKRDDFIKITQKAIKSIRSAVQFLYEELMVFDAQILPYNSQLVFFTAVFNSIGNQEPNEVQRLALKKWFWITSYSNYFSVYSLGKQRKAFEQLQLFIEDETINPVYYDNEERFIIQDFPSKINRKSVRAKTLVLFMINHAMKRGAINSRKIAASDIHLLRMGDLFSNESVAENFIPIIYQRNGIESNDGKNKMPLVQAALRQKNYEYFLKEKIDYNNLFITKEMKNIYMISSKKEGKTKILELRRKFIEERERDFIEELEKIIYLA